MGSLGAVVDSLVLGDGSGLEEPVPLAAVGVPDPGLVPRCAGDAFSSLVVAPLTRRRTTDGP